MNSTNNKLTNSLSTFIKDACQQTKDDIIEARKSGDVFAKDFVAPLKTNTGFDALVEKSASLMAQMTAGGVTLLMCPMKIAAKELEAK